jgi:hypothetical protein
MSATAEVDCYSILPFFWVIIWWGASIKDTWWCSRQIRLNEIWYIQMMGCQLDYTCLCPSNLMWIVGVMSGGKAGSHLRGSPLVFAHGVLLDMRWYYMGEGGRVPSLVMAKEWCRGSPSSIWWVWQIHRFRWSNRFPPSFLWWNRWWIIYYIPGLAGYDVDGLFCHQQCYCMSVRRWPIAVDVFWANIEWFWPIPIDFLIRYGSVKRIRWLVNDGRHIRPLTRLWLRRKIATMVRVKRHKKAFANKGSWIEEIDNYLCW